VALAALWFTHNADELDWWLPFTAAQLAISLYIAFSLGLAISAVDRGSSTPTIILVLLMGISWFMMPLTMIISTFVRAGSVSGTPDASVTWLVFSLNVINLIQLPQLFFWQVETYERKKGTA
jgi:hypothetical protein